MKLTEEAILLNWAEMHKMPELARILRGIVEKQRGEATPTSDANHHNEHLDALCAYKQALAYRNTFSRRSSEPEGPPNATVSDSTRFEALEVSRYPSRYWRGANGELWRYENRGYGFGLDLCAKHRFIRSNGETRGEACCK
jgi:hypothetical protein